MIRRPSTRSVWLALAFIDTSIVAMVSPQRKSASPSVSAFGASAGPMKLIRNADPPQTQVARSPIAPDDPADGQKPQHRPDRHAEEAEGQRQHVEPQRLLHVRDARKPDRKAERVQREDQSAAAGDGSAAAGIGNLEDRAGS